jgi:uncharacterized protein YdaU (DUF1376 family)
MPFFPADFFADTAHMTGEAAAIYLVLLGHAWLRGGTLPNDSRALAQLVRVSWQRWTSIKAEVLPFWEIGQDDLLRQKRLFHDYQIVLKKIEVASQNASKRWDKNNLDFNGTLDAKAYAKSMPSRPVRNANQNQNIKESLNGELRQGKKGNGQVYVKRDTKAGEAWNEHAKRTSGKSQVWDNAGGWYFPTEWPPAMP